MAFQGSTFSINEEPKTSASAQKSSFFQGKTFAIDEPPKAATLPSAQAQVETPKPETNLPVPVSPEFPNTELRAAPAEWQPKPVTVQERLKAMEANTEWYAKQHPEQIDPMAFFTKGISFGWAPDAPKVAPVTPKQKTMEAIGSIAGMTLVSSILNPVVGKVISKIPGAAKPLEKIALEAQRHPWAVKWPLTGAIGGLWGSLFGAITKPENKIEWAKNVLKTAGTFAAFNVLAYPIVQFFKPIVYSLGKTVQYEADPKVRTMLSAPGTETILTNPETLWFRHPTDPNIVLKVTRQGIYVVSPKEAPEPPNVYPVFGKAEIEAFRSQPSLYSQLTKFLKGIKFAAPIKPTTPVETMPPDLQPYAEQAQMVNDIDELKNIIVSQGKAEEFSNLLQKAGIPSLKEFWDKVKGPSKPTKEVKSETTPTIELGPPQPKPETKTTETPAIPPVEEKPVETKPEVTKELKPIEKEILDALPERPDFIHINANSFNKIVEKYGSKKFFDALYDLEDKGKLEINHEAQSIKIFKGTPEVKPKVKPKAKPKISATPTTPQVGGTFTVKILKTGEEYTGTVKKIARMRTGAVMAQLETKDGITKGIPISKYAEWYKPKVKSEVKSETKPEIPEEKVLGWNYGEVVQKGTKFIIRHEDTKQIVAIVPSKDAGRSFFDGYEMGSNDKVDRHLSIKKAKYLLVTDEKGNILLRVDKTRPEIAQSFIEGYKIGHEGKIDFWHKAQQTTSKEGVKPATAPETDLEKKLDKIYQENKLKEEVKRRPAAGLSVRILPNVVVNKPIEPSMVSQLRTHFNEFKKRIEEIISPLYFYKNAPMELRNAIRTDIIGGLNKVFEKRNKNQMILWGGMEEKDIRDSIEIIKLRDQLARIKADKGNPNITLKEAEEALAKAEKEASPEALQAAERYRLLTKQYTKDLIERGKLDPDDLLEDYMRHYVVDYTPDWIFNKGIPTRLRQPFRGYLKKAGQSTKEYRVDEDTILGQFLEIDHDNMIEDFIVEQSQKYDLKPKLTKEELAQVLGVDKDTGKIKPIKPGRIYIYKDKRYRGFNPAAPFGRVIFPTEEGLMALGKYKKTYLIPEEVYNTFRDFSERGSAAMFYLNRVVSYWKTMAILSHITSFNINNLVGDTWMMLSQTPEPWKVLSEIPTALNYLINKNPSKYLKELDKFIKDNDIIAGTYIQGELPKIRRATNPLTYLLQKSQDLSQLREAIMRTANASYLFKELKKGNEAKLIRYFSYMGLEGLPKDKALGKIARDIVVDYKWISKTFNRVIRGLGFPFGTWYFKGSSTMWKFTAKHWGKALLAFLSIPLIAVLFNNRNKKIKELEGELSPNVQDRVHFILGENPDGSIRVWSMQLPQDALIGTKIFTIAVNQANLVAIGQKTVKQAAIDTIKRWGIKEAKGIAYLTNFFIRFIQGLIQQRDPYDNTSVYSMDPTKMSSSRKLRDQALYFLKCAIPIVNVYIADYTVGKPIDITTKNYMDKLIGWGALGIYDVSKKDKIYFEGKEITWDTLDTLKEIAGNEMAILDKIEDKWIASDLYPEDFIKTEEYKKLLEEMRNMYAKYVPEMKNVPLEDIAAGLGERLANRLGNSVDSAKKWYQIKLERAKTDQEKRELGQRYATLKQQNMLDAIKSYSNTARDVFEMYLKEH